MIDCMIIAGGSLSAGFIAALPLMLFIKWNDNYLKNINKGLTTDEIFRKVAKKWS